MDTDRDTRCITASSGSIAALRDHHYMGPCIIHPPMAGAEHTHRAKEERPGCKLNDVLCMPAESAAKERRR
jgi:hypothetical protein